MFDRRSRARPEKPDCQHLSFSANVDVIRIENIGGFAADVTIHCKECQTRMVFLGLPEGVNLAGAARSVDGTQARLGIAPEGTTETFLSKLKASGFGIERVH